MPADVTDESRQETKENHMEDIPPMATAATKAHGKQRAAAASSRSVSLPAASSAPSPVTEAASEDQDAEMKEAGDGDASIAAPASGRTHYFGVLFTPPYHEQTAQTLQVRWIYRAVNFLTELFFGVDKDLDHLPQKRKSIVPTNRSGADILNNPLPSLLPPQISAGYGELSWQGFDKIVHWMEQEAPDAMKLNSKSRFLDIGSGFGKCVFHARLRAQVARSVGIECIKTRHEKALEALHLLRAGFVPGLSDREDAPSFESVRDMDLNACELFLGDISLPKFHPLVFASTHIYAFDVVFSKDTHARILPIVEQSDFQLFGCYLSPQKLALFGCKLFHLEHTIKVHTTGKQSFTCYLYSKKQSDTPSSSAAASSRHSPPKTISLQAPIHNPAALLQSKFSPESDKFWEELHEKTSSPEAYLAEAQAAREVLAAEGAKLKATKAPRKAPADSDSNVAGKKNVSKKRPSTSTSKVPASKKPRKNSKAAVAESSDDSSEEEEEDEAVEKRRPSAKKKKQPTKYQRKVAVVSSSSEEESESEAEVEQPVKRPRGRPRKHPLPPAPVTPAPTTAASKPAPTTPVAKPTPTTPAAKPLSRGQLFDLASAAALKPKPSVPRRTNNSVLNKIEAIPEQAVPKRLQQYLMDAAKPEKPLLLDEQEALSTAAVSSSAVAAEKPQDASSKKVKSEPKSEVKTAVAVSTPVARPAAQQKKPTPAKKTELRPELGILFDPRFCAPPPRKASLKR